jgi:hypothetical protein
MGGSEMEYWLHYVGRGLYDVDSFVEEAKRYGVQRGIAFYKLRDFRWGDEVLLATYLNQNGEVFGYFVVEGITHNMPPELCEKLISKLDVVAVKNDPPKFERRRCGSYYLGGGVVVRDSLESIFEKILQLCKENKVNPNSFKWFLKGPFKDLPSILLSPAKFFRGYNKINIDLNLDKSESLATEIVYIYNYRQRGYLRKRDEVALGQKPIESYFGEGSNDG